MPARNPTQRSAHARRVRQRVPCPASCRCANVLDTSVAEVYRTHRLGRGVRATVDIPAGRWIAEYTGVRRSGEDLDAAGHGAYVMMLRCGEAIDGEARDALAHFVNHRCVGFNAVFVESASTRRVHLQALEDIPAGSQIFVDYGPDYTFERCLCPACR